MYIILCMFGSFLCTVSLSLHKGPKYLVNKLNCNATHTYWHSQEHFSVGHFVLLDHVRSEVESRGVGKKHDGGGGGEGDAGQMGLPEGGLVGGVQLLLVEDQHPILLTQTGHRADVLDRLRGCLPRLLQGLLVLTFWEITLTKVC